MADIGQSKGPP
jgi:putative SOS response-associated peptidase YedK